MSSEQDRRNTEVTKKTNDRAQEPFNKQNPNDPVEVAAEKKFENLQENQKTATQGNNPHPNTDPAENLRAKTAKAEDKSQSAAEPT